MWLGSTDDIWLRPQATHTIIACITFYPSLLHGGPSPHTMRKDLLGIIVEDSLTSDQMEKLETKLKGQETRYIEREHSIKFIFLTVCILMIPQTFRYRDPVSVSKSSNKPRFEQTLIIAINRFYVASEPINYTSKYEMDDDLFQWRTLWCAELETLSTHLESATKDGDKEIRKAFYSHAPTGVFHHLGSFIGLLKDFSIHTKQCINKKKLQCHSNSP